MGYRSDVIYGAEFESAEKAEAAYLAAKIKFSTEGIYFTMDNYFKTYENLIIFEQESVKWYDGYADVEYVDSIFNFFGELGAGCRKVRVGEEDTDTEIEDYGNEDMIEALYEIYIVREITRPSWNFSRG